MTADTAPDDSPETGPTGAPLRRPAAFEARFTAGFVGRLAADSMVFARSNARSSQLRRQVSTSPRGSISALVLVCGIAFTIATRGLDWQPQPLTQ